jgi:hypothetical protein
MTSASNKTRGFRNRAAMLPDDQHGASRSIEVVAAVAVGILILAALLKMIIGQGGFLSGTESQLAKLMKGEPVTAGSLPNGTPDDAPGDSDSGTAGDAGNGSDNGAPDTTPGGSDDGTPATPPSAPSTPGSTETSPTVPDTPPPPATPAPGTVPQTPSDPKQQTPEPPTDQGSGFWGRVIPAGFIEAAKWMGETHLKNLLDQSKDLAEKTKTLQKWLADFRKIGKSLDLMSGLDDLFQTAAESKKLIQQGRYKEAWENDCSGLGRFLVGMFADKAEKVPYLGKYVVAKFLIATGLTEGAGRVGGWIGSVTYDPLNRAANWLARQPWWPKNRGPRNPIPTAQVAPASVGNMLTQA